MLSRRILLSASHAQLAATNHSIRRACFGLFACLALLAAPTANAVIIVNDTWADGGRDNGADPLDTNWRTSNQPSAIEVATGSLGLVTGSTGRGIHTVFPTQTLGKNGDKLAVTYTFTTPATIGSGAASFRVGLFTTFGRVGLDADVLSSSTSPNAVYGWGTGASPTGPGVPGLPGYMMDMDVGTGTEDINFREHDTGTVNPTGRLMGTTTGFTGIPSSGPDGAYAFASGMTYTGSFTIERVTTTTFQLTGTLGAASHSITDTFDSPSFGMLAFWANGNTFGSSSTPNTSDNGIDFTSVIIEFTPTPVPEPSSLALLGFGSLLLIRRIRHTSKINII